ncbi:TIGR02234 family membrane protein [Corynebacterium glyciniphilum]|uniref:Putative membrane protein n=1 Tax=Corynebacterium glyciniphilum AJ 3170 TaxID=1404245 RepID=X5DUM4_9CORY|nr:TIGR02234 family membrane protein [Corynebacterium glyciniphilum]AHW64342.1 Putative membrane protein [Corynebacterium glyciniphilum AJ 3170]
MKRLGGRSLALLLTVLSAAGLWGAGQMTWLTVTVEDDKSGESVKNIIGSVWDAAGTPLALAMLAAMILSMALQPLARRILGGVSALLAAVAGIAAVMLLSGEPDLSRAQSLLVSGAGTQRESDPVQISEWAVVLDGHVHTAPVVLFLVAAALGVVGGVLLAMKPGAARSGHSKYETPEARREGVEKDLDDNPGSGRVLWDALDAGVDPTDRDTGDGEPRV